MNPESVNVRVFRIMMVITFVPRMKENTLAKKLFYRKGTKR